MRKLLALFVFLTATCCSTAANQPVIFYGSNQNDLYKLLKESGYTIQPAKTVSTAIEMAQIGASVFIVSDSYPQIDSSLAISPTLHALIVKKKLHVYLEFPSSFPRLHIDRQPLACELERAVVTSDVFKKLKPMSIIDLHNCYVLQIKETISKPLAVMARVVGLDVAVYGLDSTTSYPLLFESGGVIISTTALSRFSTARYGPSESIRAIWSYLLNRMLPGQAVRLDKWPTEVAPMFSANAKLPPDARKQSIQLGTDWFYKAKFLVHPEWKDFWLKYPIQGDGTARFGPAVPQTFPSGDGSLGILEGHASSIAADGSQLYRYWMRADVQGESGMTLAAAGSFLDNETYRKHAANLLDYLFIHSNLRSGSKADTSSDVFGMIGWATTFPGSFYGDDNARALLGAIAASAYLNDHRWDQYIVEAIMGNFRRTSEEGYSGERNEEKKILERGWRYYANRHFTYYSPNFEAWMWACYLWLYDKTGYRPLLDKTKTAISLIMQAYPQKWLWGSSLQSQRVRMLLPLAWLCRIENTDEHRQWLDQVATDLLKSQEACGAIREEIGQGKGHFKELRSNKDYGTDEGSMIYQNGDPIADMLYTNNFALFTLNEAAQATGNPVYRNAVSRLSDFLVRIQIHSDSHHDLDGAWFRAFDYKRWDYWASNSDWGWGAWCTLTGWCQSWIVTMQIQIEQQQNFWDITHHSDAKSYMPRTIRLMFPPDHDVGK